MNKDEILGIFLEMVLIAVLLFGMFQAGHYEGLKDYCPEPNVIVEQKAGGYGCVSENYFEQDNIFEWGDYYNQENNGKE